MLKKLLLASIFIAFSIGNVLHAQEEKAPEPGHTKSHIAFVLFKLIGGKIKMEKYNAEEFDKEITEITKKKAENCLTLTINLKEKGALPRVIQWDDQSPGKIDILTGKGNKANVYTILLKSLFKETNDEVLAICFDCKVQRERITPEDISHLDLPAYKDEEWKSQVDVILPINIGNTKISLVFNEKVKSACGFFMENEDFEKLLRVRGNIKKKEAIKSEVLYLLDEEPNETTEEEEDCGCPLDPSLNSEQEQACTLAEVATEESPEEDCGCALTSTTPRTEEPEITEGPGATPEEVVAVKEEEKEEEEIPCEICSMQEEEKPATNFFSLLSTIKDGVFFIKDTVIAKIITVKEILFSLFKRKK